VRPRELHKSLMKKGFTKKELNKVIDICRPCHSAIHKYVLPCFARVTLLPSHFCFCVYFVFRIFTNKEMADEWNTLEKLLSDERVMRWINYIRKQKVRAKKDAQNPKIHYRK
jgi:hypothetical protein